MFFPYQFRVAMSVFTGGDPVATNLQSFISEIESGRAPRDIENDWVDAKEEAGRRDGATILPSQRENEEAARVVAEAAACFANSATGGAVLVGIADDGTPLGTDLGAAWLRHRISELTGGDLVPFVTEQTVRGARCLAVYAHPSPLPIRVGGRVRMRVDDTCQPVPEGHWLQVRVATGVYDWSRQVSGAKAEEASATALEAARRFLTESGEPSAAELAAQRDPDLLQRLDVVTIDGWLTNAGALLFRPTDRPVLDYVHRERPGQPSRLRVERGDVSALEQFTEVMTAIRLAIPSTQVLDAGGTAVGAFPALPERARREAVVNAVAHRNWIDDSPITIELINASLTVVSPGGLVGGITPGNIITHPSVRRSPHLTEVLAKLRLAEREAVGVDTMFLEMLRDGHPAPVFEESATHVRVVLAGGQPDNEWVSALRQLEPTGLRDDLNATLMLDHLARTGFATASAGAAVLQRSETEAAATLSELTEATLRGAPIVVHVDGSRSRDEPAFKLSGPGLLGTRGHGADPTDRAELLIRYAQQMTRLTTREAMSLTGVTRPTALSDLEALVESGVLEPGGAGPTAHYVLDA